MLLALFMILTSFPLNAFAAQKETSVRNEITDIKTVGDKQVINLGNVRGEKPQLRFFSRGARLFGAPAPQAGSSSETVAQKVEINLSKMGLNLEEDQFDPSALTEVGSFDVTITFKELGGTRTETRTMTFQAGETKKTETFYLPKDFGNGNVEAEIPKLKQNIALRVYVGANSTTNFTLGDDMSFDFELTQIIHPVIDLKVVDPYGKELQENINQALGLKLNLADEHDFTLPANTKTFNIRSLSKFAGNNIEDLNSAGDDPKLSLTTQLQDKKLTVGNKTYKLNKITYNALGQEVEINGQKKKVGGYIEFATQPKIIVPTPDEGGGLPKTPDGYKRLSFYAETSANAQDGRFENGEKLKVIDVLEGTEYTDTDLQNQIKGIGQPTPIIYGRKDDNKKFLKWKPELPTTGPVADTDFRPVYLADGGEITPGEPLPKGVFEVKVIKDNTIADDPDKLYGKSYGVFQGSKLARDKFPDLEAAKGYKDPKWTTEADAPNTGMVEIKKPWTKEITKATTFKATAAEKAATQIKKEGLKAVDTTALQGQELDEKFWHKGVELADNTPADKKDAFAALLKEATVTDITNPARTTAEAGDKVGTLLVTFKDGSTLEVEKQKLIVKPNTVKVELDKDAQGAEKPLRDGDTTVKGKISASSNSEKFPVNLDGALVTIKKGDTVLSRTLAKADGSFVAGVKDPLVAGEDISVVVTLPESKTESAPVTEKVQLNPDKLNSIIPTGKEVFKNFDGKKGVNQDLVKKLKAALDEADKLVDDKGKVKSTVTVDANSQGKLDTAYENIKKAIEALTGNSAPKVEGNTSHKEIFKGDALNLEEGITVTDPDGEKDIALQGNKKFIYTVEKIGDKGAKEVVKDTTKINQTPGTYEVTYTAKDKSGAEGKFVMTLVVKEPVVEIKDNFPEVIPEGYVKVEFKEGAHGTLEGTTKFLVKDGSAKTVLNAPTIKPNANYEAKKDANWDPAIPETFTGTEENKKSFTFTAQYTYIGKDVVPQKPGDKKPDVPDNFVKVEFKKGDHGVISSEETTIYWVNPEKEVTLTAPTVTPSHGYKHTGWNPEVKEKVKYTEAKEFVAQYKPTVVTEDPNDKEHYAKVDFAAGDQGKFEQVGGKDQVTTFWVWKGEKVSFNAPKVTANKNYKFKEWDKPIQETYDGDTTHTATYESTLNISDEEVKGYHKVTFKAGDHGTLTEKSVWVKPDTLVDLNDKAPEVTPEKGYSHSGWEPALIGKFADGTNIVAQYNEEKTPEPTVTARNIGTKGPDGKRVPAIKTTVEIETVPKAKVTIEYTDKDGHPQKIENLTAGVDGKLTQEIQPKLKDGTDVKVTVQDGEKKPAEKTVKVFDDLDDNKIPDNQAGQTERPAALASNIGKKPTFTTITGEAEKGATVTAKVGNVVVGTATADKTTGKYTIQAKQNNAPIKEGVKIDVTATLAPKTESLKQTVVVFNDTDGTGQPDSSKDFDVKKAKEMQVVASPDKMVYSDGDKLNLDGLKVLVTDVNGNQKIFTYKHDANTEFTKAGLSVDLKQETVLSSKDYNAQTAKDGHNGRKLVVTLDTTGNTQVTEAITGETPTALTVNKNQSAQPTDVVAANQGDATVTKVKGKATKDAEIKITDANGNSLLPDGKTIKADANGDFNADLNKLLDPGIKVLVTATEPGKSESPKAETPVIRDKDGNWEADTGSKLSTPVIDPIREKDEKVVVEAPTAGDKIQTIEVSDQNGKTVRLTKDPDDKTGKTWKVDGSNDTVKENNEGKLEIPVKDKLPLNDRDQIKVTFKDGENPANEAFDRAFVQKASQTPKVDPVYTGDKFVKIVDPTVADPTAKTIKVKVNDNDSMTVEKQADGSWKVKEDPNKVVTIEDGKIVVPLDPSAKKDEVIQVSTINDSGKASPAAKVTVVDKEKLDPPTINPIKIGDKTVAGTALTNEGKPDQFAASTVDIYKKNDQGGYDLIKEGVGVNSDGTYNYPGTTDFKDGDVIRVVANKPGWTSSAAETTVGVDTTALDKAIQDGKDALDPNKGGINDGTPEDKALEKAIQDAEDLKKRTDPKPPTQKELDDAKDKIEKAIENKKKTDEERQKLKDIIKEAEEETKKDGYKDKPESDKTALEKAIADGKENLANNTKIVESTTTIQEKLDIIRMERIRVGVDSLAVGMKTLEIKTSVPGATVKIKINGVLIDTIETDAYGNFSKGLETALQKKQRIVLEASKLGYNDGIFRDRVQ